MHTLFNKVTFFISLDVSLGESVPGSESSEAVNTQGWASWAWSYVPQILPTEEEEEDQTARPHRKPPPSVFSFGMYGYKLTLKFKVPMYTVFFTLYLLHKYN